VSFLRHYPFNTNFEYLVYENKTVDFDQQIPLLKLSVSGFILKNRSGELNVGVNNLLDKALSVDQTSDINYTERVTTNSLGLLFYGQFYLCPEQAAQSYGNAGAQTDDADHQIMMIQIIII